MLNCALFPISMLWEYSFVSRVIYIRYTYIYILCTLENMRYRSLSFGETNRKKDEEDRSLNKCKRVENNGKNWAVSVN